jgi:hypothetical protein
MKKQLTEPPPPPPAALLFFVEREREIDNRESTTHNSRLSRALSL